MAEIQVREKCPVCAGKGSVESDWWKALRQREQQYRDKYQVDEWDLQVVVASWVHEAGYSDFNDPTLPAEQVPCPTCAGDKYVLKWVPLNELTAKNQLASSTPT